MKLKHFAIAMAISSVAFVSCDNDKDDDTTSTTVTTNDTLSTSAATASVNDVAQQAAREGTATVVTNDQVPEPVRKSFTTKYPKIQTVEWYTYTPVPEDELVMDDSYYYVRFNDNGTDYISWYNNRGEWVKTSTKVTPVPGNKNLPDAVNKYINDNYAGYSIEEISKENDKNIDMYEIKLSNGDTKKKIKILPNGEIFKSKTNS